MRRKAGEQQETREGREKLRALCRLGVLPPTQASARREIWRLEQLTRLHWAARTARIPAAFTSLRRRRCEWAALSGIGLSARGRQPSRSHVRLSPSQPPSLEERSLHAPPVLLSTGFFKKALQARTLLHHAAAHDTPRHDTLSSRRYTGPAHSTCTCTDEVIAASADAGSS